MITTARILLALSAAMLAAIGALVVADPTAMEPPGVTSNSLTGITTIRTWGALFLASGITSAAMAAHREWLLPGLILVTMIGLVIVASRLAGMAIDGIEPRQWVELRREATGFVIALAGLVVALIAKRRQ